PGGTLTAAMIADSARAIGTHVVATDATGRDAASIDRALVTDACDLLLTIGGSGVGRDDATIAALAQRGRVLTHGIALQPGRSAAIATIGRANLPVIALPGTPDHALAAWRTVAVPALDRLSGRQPRHPVTLPLARKIASSVGIAEI